MSSKPGRVLQQVDQPHGIGRVPRVVDGDLGRELLERRLDIELALLIQLDEAHGDERLADRPDAEVRVAGHRRLPLTVRQSHAAGPLDASRANEREPRAGHTGFSDDAGGGCLKVFERLRRRVVRWRGRRLRVREGDIRHDERDQHRARADAWPAPAHLSHLRTAPPLSHLTPSSHVSHLLEVPKVYPQ